MTDTYEHHMQQMIRVLVYIEEHLDETLELADLARVANISPFYFHRLFRAYLGETVAGYVKRIRLQRARSRLSRSEVPVTDIALEVGYETPSAFTKMFNRAMGMSPLQYRKSLQPAIHRMIERTNKETTTMQPPEIVNCPERTVLFVRRIGDYNQTAFQAYEALFKFIKERGLTDKIIARYGMGLDDPGVVEAEQLRFDACVALSVEVPPSGEVGKKVIPGGRHAVFRTDGPYRDLASKIDEIFREWYPSSKAQPGEHPLYVEYLGEMGTGEGETKIYIPLASKIAR